MPVGHYGNGFKSGSMRLGKDAIVLTKTGNTRSVGFLSQTYLEAIKAETILVPMVTWDSDGNILYYLKKYFSHVNKGAQLKTDEFVAFIIVLPRSKDVRAKLEFGALS